MSKCKAERKKEEEILCMGNVECDPFFDWLSQVKPGGKSEKE